MTFEKWWDDFTGTPNDDCRASVDYARAAWQAATLAERERCNDIIKVFPLARFNSRMELTDAIRKGEGV